MDHTVNALTSILEPVLIVFLGVIVGAIVIALYFPRFNIPKNIGKEEIPTPFKKGRTHNAGAFSF